MFTEQFGFRKEKSSEDAAFRLADSVFESINQKMHVGGIFCEFVKGCDLWIMKFCHLHYISMEFEEYLTIFSRLIYPVEDRKLK